MNGHLRDQRIADAFVTVSDALVMDYDIIDMLHTLVTVCVDLLHVDAGGLLLADEAGGLQVVASTSEQVPLVKVMQLGAGTGPCVDCYREGRSVIVGDVGVDGADWPAFREEALQQGFHAVFATPLRLRGQVLGAMTFFSGATGGPSEHDALLAQALADIATIGILQERTLRESHILEEQLQRALDSRVLIEQAKGVLTVVGSMDLDEAFRTLRKYSRSHNMPLRVVAQAVVDRSLPGLLESLSPQP